MKQIAMKAGEWPAALLTIPGHPQYFRMALKGKTRRPKRGTRVVVMNMAIQPGSDMDESDFRAVAHHVTERLLAHFKARGWNPVKFIKVPLPRLVPRVQDPTRSITQEIS